MAVLQDLLEIGHRVSRIKARDAGAMANPALDPALPALAAELSLGSLTRAWQILLRGIEEADRAPDPSAAAEMVLLRLATAAQLPPPAELLRLVREEPGGAAGSPSGRVEGGSGTVEAHRNACAR